MLVVTRFEVPESDGELFLGQAREALAAFACRPGYRRGRVGRAADDPSQWVLTTEWTDVGSYRRSLSAYEVKVKAAPLLARGRDEASAFEVLLASEAAATGTGDPTTTGVSHRARDADHVGVGQAASPRAGR